MRDFARYVILSPAMALSAMARAVPLGQSGNPFCDSVNLDHKDTLGLDARSLPAKSLARDKRNPAS